jgi:hypothetical protein
MMFDITTPVPPPKPPAVVPVQYAGFLFILFK